MSYRDLVRWLVPWVLTRHWMIASSQDDINVTIQSASCEMVYVLVYHQLGLQSKGMQGRSDVVSRGRR